MYKWWHIYFIGHNGDVYADGIEYDNKSVHSLIDKTFKDEGEHIKEVKVKSYKFTEHPNETIKPEKGFTKTIQTSDGRIGYILVDYYDKMINYKILTRDDTDKILDNSIIIS